jgi:glutamyl-tRNA synthetase
MAYKEMGYLPEALVNYLVRLGWSYGDQEIFTTDELTRHFSFEHVGKSAAVFNPEKLLWLNSQYIMHSSPERLLDLVLPFLLQERIIREDESPDRAMLSKAVVTLQERARTLVELAQSLRYYIAEDVEYNSKAKEKFLNEKYLGNLVAIRESLGAVDSFVAAEIEKVFVATSERLNAKLGNIAQPVRVAVTGKTESPGIFEVLEVLGKEKTLRRLEKAIQTIHGN